MKFNRDLLLVEDDEVDAMTVKRALKEVGVSNHVQRMCDGLEALEYLKDPDKPRPALIILDINMPRMNGHEFLETVKSNERLRCIPVIVLTTSTEESDRLVSFGQSVAGYMIKPLDYNRFVGVMRAIRDYWMVSESPP